MDFLPDYVYSSYKVERERKSYTCYLVDEVSQETNLLTDLIRIEKFQGCSDATGIEDYLRIRDTTNWATSSKITGLRPSKREGFYYGDCHKPELINCKNRTLIIVYCSKCRKNVITYVFRDFYPINKGLLKNIIKRLK
jgi:hypothetical protein